MMSNTSFFVVLFVLFAGCAVLAKSQRFVGPTPIVDKGFLDDFFSETSELIPSSDREKAKKFIDANHATPRYIYFTADMSLTRVPARFCLPNFGNGSSEFEMETSSGDFDLDSCEWLEYGESLLLLSGVTFIVAILVFPILFCGLGIGRCCCCGKYRPTPNLCCGDADDFEATTNGYTDLNVLVLFIISIVVCAILAIAVGFGIAGSVQMTENVYAAANFSNQTTFKFVDVLDSVIEVFYDISDQGDNLSEAVDLDTLETASDVGSKIENVTDFIAEYADLIDLPRRIVMYVTLILPLVLMILLIISRFVCWWMSWGMTFCGFIITAMALIIFGVLYPLASGISDACVFMDEALENPDNNTFFQSIFQCNEDSPLGKFTTMANDVIDKATNLTCGIFEQLEEVYLPCDADGDGKIYPLVNSSDNYCQIALFRQDEQECNSSTFSSLAKSIRIYDRWIGCFYSTDGIVFERDQECTKDIHSLSDYDSCPNITGRQKLLAYCGPSDLSVINMSQCAEKCVDHDVQNGTAQVEKYVTAAAHTFDIYNEKIKPYINCETLVEIVSRAKDFTCVDVINSVTPMYVGEIMSAVGSFIGTFVALLATKRFHKLYRRKYAILSEGSKTVELVP